MGGWSVVTHNGEYVIKLMYKIKASFLEFLGGEWFVIVQLVLRAFLLLGLLALQNRLYTSFRQVDGLECGGFLYLQAMQWPGE